MVGRTVGTYKLIGKLGEGGMGTVYQGLDLMVQRDVAIKVLRPEIARQPEILERFRAEAIALAKLNHPHIATLYSFFREGEEYFMVMEFVSGRTLESILRDSPPFPPPLAVSIASQVLDAIDHAGNHGILHRDIKPANIMLTASAEVKVTDFGIARVLGNARLTREGCAYGTLEYLAPERIRGQEGDVRSDFYSLGVVLYEMLSHHLPFERTSEYELMRAHLEEAPPPLAAIGFSSIPPKIEQVVTRALAKLPEERFASAADFHSALAAVAEDGARAPNFTQADAPALQPAGATSPLAAAPISPRPTSSSKLRWAIYAAAALILSAVALTVALSWKHAHHGAGAAEAPATAQPPQPAPQPETPVIRVPETNQNYPPRPDMPSQPSAQESSEGPAARPPRSTAASHGNAQLSRRQAALKALDESGSGASTPEKTTKNDRRSQSLDALQK